MAEDDILVDNVQEVVTKNLQLILALTVVFILILVWWLTYSELFVQSQIDGKYYNVKDFENSQDAANVLSKINLNVVKLIRHLKRKHGKDHPLVHNLLRRFNPDVINEHIPNFFDSQVAYTSRKGKSLYICLRSLHKDEDELHQFNILMFVALHEISHIATNARQHPPEFWEVFKFILTEAVEAGVYIPEDYSKRPMTYCNNMPVTYSPLFDDALPIYHKDKVYPRSSYY